LGKTPTFLPKIGKKTLKLVLVTLTPEAGFSKRGLGRNFAYGTTYIHALPRCLLFMYVLPWSVLKNKLCSREHFLKGARMKLLCLHYYTTVIK
jgi:hypothetical protein